MAGSKKGHAFRGNQHTKVASKYGRKRKKPGSPKKKGLVGRAKSALKRRRATQAKDQKLALSFAKKVDRIHKSKASRSEKKARYKKAQLSMKRAKLRSMRGR